MPKLEVLCVTMNQIDFSKINEMNIHSDVVFANQADDNYYEEFEFNGHTAKMITTKTRGVGVNRNVALLYASGEYCLLADDDVIYDDDMPERVITEFERHPDADVMIFHFITDDSIRKQRRYANTVKWPQYRGLPWGGIRIAFRLASVRKANAWFTTLFGGGCTFPSGEDSMFLRALRKSGLKIYVSNQTIGKVSFAKSTWFTGYDEKYYYGKGAFYQACYPKLKYIWIIYLAVRTNNVSEIGFFEKIKWMIKGTDGYKKLIPYNE